MTAAPFPARDRTDERPRSGSSLGQGLAALAIAVGAILMISWNAAGQGAFGVALIAIGSVALVIVESLRVRRRVLWDRQHAAEAIEIRD
jgi:hypothetical protein